jgi:hypothetical protein
MRGQVFTIAAISTNESKTHGTGVAGTRVKYCVGGQSGASELDQQKKWQRERERDVVDLHGINSIRSGSPHQIIIPPTNIVDDRFKC